MPARRELRPVRWSGDHIQILDQRRLPREERYLECRTPAAVASAIRTLAVRGAPLIGIAGGYGVALAAARAVKGVRRGGRGPSAESILGRVDRAAARLSAARPTAVNLDRAVRRVASAAAAGGVRDGALAPSAATATAIADTALAEAERIDAEEREACEAIGRFGSDLVPDGARVLTHCNTGTLATNWDGTAQAVITTAYDRGRVVAVWADETRPLLQGARLTAWELHRRGVPVTLLVDGAAGSLMARGLVDMVVVGADRIAANGDVANKVGTYPLAVLARRHRVPFVVAAPCSTIDLATPSGAAIPIEERDPREVTGELADAAAAAANPAFDVTPAALVSAIVTDAGVVRAPYRSGLRSAGASS